MTRRMSLFATLILSLFATSLACAQTRPLPTQQMASEFEQLRRFSGIPALSVRALSQGQPVFSWQSGVRRVGDGTPVGPDDRWHLGSLTKVFTVVLVARLVERGQLRWETRIRDLWPAGRPLNPAYANLTLSQLAAHRGGMKDVDQVEEGRLWTSLFTPQANQLQGRDRLAASALIENPEFQPGTQTAYRNINYVVLGRLLELRTRRSWEELIFAEVFEAFSLKTCGFGPPARRNTVPADQPWSHQFVNSRLLPMDPLRPGADNPGALGPAGTIHCGIDDASRFFYELNRALRGLSTTLSQASANWLLTADAGARMTWGGIPVEPAVPWAGGPVYLMSGSNTMNYATLLFAPTKSQVYLVTANSGHQATNDAITQVMARLVQLIGVPALRIP